MIKSPFLKLILVVFLTGFLASCEPPEAEGPSMKVRAGMVAHYKISGHHYMAEVTEANEGYTLWEFTWKKTPVFKYKTYRGLLSVYNEEEGFKTWSKFEPKVLDELFPFEVGKEVSIKGRHYSKANEEGYPFFVTINVREETEIMIKETSYPVFVLDYSIIEEHPDGRKTTTKTAWYSEEMEASLRTDFVWESGSFSMRIVALDEPEGTAEDDESQPEGLGTVRL